MKIQYDASANFDIEDIDRIVNILNKADAVYCDAEFIDPVKGIEGLCYHIPSSYCVRVDFEKMAKAIWGAGYRKGKDDEELTETIERRKGMNRIEFDRKRLEKQSELLKCPEPKTQREKDIYNLKFMRHSIHYESPCYRYGVIATLDRMIKKLEAEKGEVDAHI